jgi:hypothetical protein
VILNAIHDMCSRARAVDALIHRDRLIRRDSTIVVGRCPVCMLKISASVDVTGLSIGSVAVAVVAAAGEATRADAIEVTPWVVAPGAVTGRGTYQSPMNLCDPELELTGVGDTVQLLAGTHECDRVSWRSMARSCAEFCIAEHSAVRRHWPRGEPCSAVRERRACVMQRFVELLAA